MTAAKLRVIGGVEKIEEFDLRLPATIGRGRDNAISLPMPLVSRQHCRIAQQGDWLVVTDLNSMNGTYVGSEKVSGKAILKPGDLLTVGTVTFRAIYGAAEDHQLHDEQATGDMTEESNHILDDDTVNLGEEGTAIDPDLDPGHFHPGQIDPGHAVPAPKHLTHPQLKNRSSQNTVSDSNTKPSSPNP